MLELMKLLLGIQPTDTSLDSLLNHYLNKAREIIIGYCNIDDLPEQYNNVAAEYAVYLYKNRDAEGMLKKTEGEKSVAYEGAIPDTIKLSLPKPRIRVVGSYVQ
jgi:hypothetical protein